MANDAQRKIDLCIMDVEMPVMDGLTATRVIREREKMLGGTKTRVVGLSGNARPAQIQAGMEAGMDAFVTKPCELSLSLFSSRALADLSLFADR